MSFTPESYARLVCGFLEDEWQRQHKLIMGMGKNMRLEDDWLGGEAWSFGTPSTSFGFSSSNDKTQLAKELLLLAVRLEDLAKDLDKIRERLGKL